MAHVSVCRLAVICPLLLLTAGQEATAPVNRRTSGASILNPECFRTYDVNISLRIVCPASCPVVSSCQPVSKVRCVRAADCGTIHIAGAAVNGVCVWCPVAGCDACASKTTCSVCKDVFELQDDGTCLWKDYSTWTIIIGVAFLLFMWVLGDFLVSHCRPVTNMEALRSGLRHRSRCKVRDETQTNRPLFPLSARMHTEPICGPAMPLFLNWFRLVMALGLWLTALAIIFRPTDSTFDSMDNLCSVLHPKEILDVLDPITGKYSNETAIEFDVSQELASHYYDRGMILWVSLAYFGATLMSAVFLVWQRNLWHKLQSGKAIRPMLHRYAIEASGFPDDSIDSNEVSNYWREVLRTVGVSENGLVEISIAYKFAEETDKVDHLIDQHLITEEFRVLSEMSGEQKEQANHTAVKHLGTTGDGSQSRHLGKGATQQIINRPGTLWVQLISSVMLGTDFEMCRKRRVKGWSSVIHEQEVSSADMNYLLRRMRSSGSVIVVFNTIAAKKSVISRLTMPVRFRGVFPINVYEMNEEPQGILWHNYGIPPKTHNRRILVGLLVMLVVLTAWALLYWPWSEFTKNSIGTVSYLATTADLLVSMTIPIGNALVAFTVAGLMDYYGFRHAGHLRTAYLLVIVPCLFLNVMSDLFVTFRNSLLSLSDELADSPNFLATFGTRAVMEDMFALLFPGYSLIPYVGEPLCCVCIPFFVGLWRIKQDSRISGHYAEKLMAAAEIDIVNPAYGDIVATTSTFMVTFCAPSRQHWKIFGAYFFFGAFLYAQNRYRILRWQSSTYFGTLDEHVTVSHLWALPLSILAASFGGHLASDPRTGWMMALGAFGIHNIIHFVFVRCAITWHDYDEAGETYGQALARRGIAANYRNTNPIEVLKSQHLPERRLKSQAAQAGMSAQTWQTTKDGKHVFDQAGMSSQRSYRPLVFYRPGKDNLQPKGGGGGFEGDEPEVALRDIMKRNYDIVTPVNQAVANMTRGLEQGINGLGQKLGVTSLPEMPTVSDETFDIPLDGESPEAAKSNRAQHRKPSGKLDKPIQMGKPHGKDKE